MAALWTTVMMAALISVIHAFVDDVAHATVGRPSLAPTETFETKSTLIYNTSMKSVDDKTKAPIVKYENTESPRRLFRALLQRQRTISKRVPGTMRTQMKKRRDGWFVRTRIFRSDLG